MDVKELIKWLFQVKPSSEVPSNPRGSSNSRFNAHISGVFLVLVILNTLSLSECIDNDSHINGDITSVTKENKQNENKTVTYQLLITADSKSEINSTQNKLKSFYIDSKTKEDFRAAAGILRRLRDLNRVLDENAEKYVGKDTARTFGRPIKKLQAMMIPLMFKLGVLSTIIFLTFLLALKGVVIGKILMMLSSASLLASLAKLFFLKGSHGQDDLSKQVHLHIHNSGIGHGAGWSSSYSYPVSNIPHTGHEAWNRRQESYNPENQNFFHQTGLGASVINTPYGRYVRTGAPTGLGFNR